MDLENEKNEFTKYAKTFDMTNFQIKRKYLHSFRVMKLCETIAQSLSLTQEEVKIACLIGLLHDIARFEQFTKFQTFRDAISFDHGYMGVQILKKNSYIRNYIEIDTFDDIIFSAIQNHNKFHIEDSLSDKELLFAKIVRDADKLDILYQATTIFWNNEPEAVKMLENSIVEDTFLHPFFEKRPVNRIADLPNANNELMHFLSMLGFVFDINFEESFKILRERNYMNDLIERFDFKDTETKNKIKNIREIVNDYIKERS